MTKFKRPSKTNNYNRNNDFDDEETLDGSFIARNSGFSMGRNNNNHNAPSLPRVRNNTISNGLTSAMVGKRSKTVSDLKELRAAYAELQTQYSRLEASESSARSHLHQSATQFAELQEQAKKHKRGYEKYKETSKRNETIIQQLKGERDDLYEMGSEAQKQLNERAKCTKLLNLQIVELQQNISKLKSNIQEKEQIVADKSDVIKQITIDMEEISMEKLKLNEKVQLLEKEKKVENEAKICIQKNLVKTNDEVSQLASDVKAMKSELEITKKELKRKNEYLNESKTERSKVAMEVDKYKEKLLHMENKLKEKNTTIQSTAELVKTQSSKLLEQNQRIAHLQNELMEINNGKQENIDKSLHKDAVITKLNSSFQDEVKQEIEAKSFFLE